MTSTKEGPEPPGICNVKYQNVGPVDYNTWPRLNGLVTPLLLLLLYHTLKLFIIKVFADNI